MRVRVLFVLFPQKILDELGIRQILSPSMCGIQDLEE